jgi:hypothetical protein
MANYRTSIVGVVIMASALYQLYTSEGQNDELLKHLTSPEFLDLLVGGGLLMSRDAHNGNDSQ